MRACAQGDADDAPGRLGSGLRVLYSGPKWGSTLPVAVGRNGESKTDGFCRPAQTGQWSGTTPAGVQWAKICSRLHWAWPRPRARLRDLRAHHRALAVRGYSPGAPGHDGQGGWLLPEDQRNAHVVGSSAGGIEAHSKLSRQITGASRTSSNRPTSGRSRPGTGGVIATRGSRPPASGSLTPCAPGWTDANAGSAVRTRGTP